MPDTRLVYSLWNLRNNLWMEKSQLCRPSILSKVTKNKNELWKTAIAIRFNLLQVCPSLTPFLFVAWFIPYSYLFECFFFKVSLNLAAVPSVCILIHFMTQLSLSNLNNCSFYFLFISSQISDLTQEAYFFKAVKRYSRGGWSFHQSYSNNFPNSWWEKQSRACQWEWRHLQNHVANNIHAWICKKYQYVYVFIYLDPLYMEWGTLV